MATDRKDGTRNERQARRRQREKQWLESHSWSSWEAMHTALINGKILLEKRNNNPLIYQSDMEDNEQKVNRS